MNSTNWPAPNVWDLVAQLVEHCSANAEATDSNPVEAPKTFFGLNCDCLNRKHKGDDHTFISIKGNVISEWEIPLVSRLVIGNCYISTARRSPQICIFHNWKQYCELCTQQVFVFWYFAAVLFLLTTWNEQFCLCADLVSTWGQIFNVFVKL